MNLTEKQRAMLPAEVSDRGMVEVIVKSPEDARGMAEFLMKLGGVRAVECRESESGTHTLVTAYTGNDKVEAFVLGFLSGWRVAAEGG